MNGWVALHRCITEKVIWLDSTPEQKTILVTLLLMANHKEQQWVWNGEKFTAKPGQFVTSIDNIAKQSGRGITKQIVRTALVKFEKLEFLTNQSTKTGRLITLVNWDLYQGDLLRPNIASNKDLTKHQQRPNKDLTPNNNDNNDNNDNNVKKSIYGERVKMTAEEHRKLVEQFGEVGAKDRIENLNLYKGSTGKSYKSDYLTILSWERKDRAKGGQARDPTTQNSGSAVAPIGSKYKGVRIVGND